MKNYIKILLVYTTFVGHLFSAAIQPKTGRQAISLKTQAVLKLLPQIEGIEGKVVIFKDGTRQELPQELIDLIKLAQNQDQLDEMLFNEIEKTSPDFDKISSLIDLGANIEVRRDFDGATPLMYAAENGLLDLAKYLIEQHGANVHATSYGSPISPAGETVLMFAVKGGSLDLVKYLVENYNVDLAARNQKQETAGVIAQKQGKEDILEYLIEKRSEQIKF